VFTTTVNPSMKAAEQLDALEQEWFRLENAYGGFAPQRVEARFFDEVRAPLEERRKLVLDAMDEMTGWQRTPGRSIHQAIEDLRLDWKRVNAAVGETSADAKAIREAYLAQRKVLTDERAALLAQKGKAKATGKLNTVSTSGRPAKFDPEQYADWDNLWDRDRFWSWNATDPQLGEKQTRLWEQVASGPQRHSTREYTGGLHSDLNRWLRGGRPSTGEGYHKAAELEKHTKAIHAGFQHAEAKIPMEITLHRGTRIRDAHEWWSAQVGDVISDKGFMSTTISKGTAQGFRGNLKMVLYVPPDAKGLWVQPFSKIRSENEVLWDIGQTWRVLKTETTTEHGQKRLLLVLEYVPKP
jgi:hypothetical protein